MLLFSYDYSIDTRSHEIESAEQPEFNGAFGGLRMANSAFRCERLWSAMRSLGAQGRRPVRRVADWPVRLSNFFLSLLHALITFRNF